MSRYRPGLAVLFLELAVAAAASAHDDPLFLSARQPPVVSPLYSGRTGTAEVDFPASGVTLMGWMTLDQFGSHTSGNDCWGYVSGSGREYAIIGLSDGIAFVEVTDPGQPRLVKTIATVNSLWRDVKVYQNYAYYVSEGGDGIKVANLSQIDNDVVNVVATVNTPGTSATHNVALNEASGYLYRCGGGGSTVGLRIYSLANPASPAYVAQWHNRYVHDAQVVSYTSGPYAGKEIAFCFSEDGAGGGNAGVDILDVTNKSNIVVLSRLTYSTPAFSHQGWLSPDRTYLYIDDELDESNYGYNTRTRVADVTNLSSPSQVAYFSSGKSAIDHNLYTNGSFIYEANYRSGIRIFDATNPTSPVQTAWFDTYPENDSPEFNGLWSNYPYFPSGTVIGSDLEKGLFVWRVGTPTLTLSVLGGEPELLNPLGDSLVVQIQEESPGDLLAGSGKLHYDAGAGWVEVPLVSLGGGQFRADFPALACGDLVSYYLSARSQDGSTWTGPVAAPTYLYLAASGFGTLTLIDQNMETNPAWTVGAAGDNATTGIWTRVNPVGTAAQPEDDHSDPGTMCWVTGQGSVGGGLGDNDVDNGKTTLTTNTINLGTQDAVISYWRWYSNVTGGSPNEDTFLVDISNNNGSTWTNVETVGPSGPDTIGGWIFHQFTVSDYVAPSAQIKVRFVAQDLFNGSIVEAAVDDFKVERFDCTGACQTDLGFKGPGNATLSICGEPLDSGNSALLQLESAPANKLMFLFVSNQNNPTPFRGGTLIPLPVTSFAPFLTNGAGELAVTVSGGGGPLTLYLQAVISDPPQVQGVSLSNALQVSVGP